MTKLQSKPEIVKKLAALSNHVLLFFKLPNDFSATAQHLKDPNVPGIKPERIKLSG